MKKELQKLVALIAILFLPFVLWSQGYGVKLEESFEKGIPVDWTYEKVRGDMSWVVNSGDLTYPNGAFDGASRIEFRGNTNVTTKATTRLITPVMDIQGIYQPILVFAHAQSTWTDDFDTLKVLYRAAADKEWTTLKVYDYPIKKWTRDTVRLIGGSQTYQIAFEASDNLGRGVVIDTVLVRSTPRCQEPSGLNVFNVTNESVTIGWYNDGDAKTLNLKVSTTQLSAEQLESDTIKADVLDTIVAKNLYRYNLSGLKAGTKYYYYLRSNCGEDISGWSNGDFKTSNLIYPGITFNFNSNVSNCHVGASENTATPYINTGADATVKSQLSPDATNVLCFNGSVDKKATTAIPSNLYSYIALPQMEVGENKKMSDLYVSFYAMNYNPYNAERSSIIVGVMTDPTDYYSFEAVDTVDITSMRVFEQCFVSLEKYEGEGKFIAFLSDFAKSNLFVMDNLKVDYRPEVLKVNNFKMRLTSSTQVEFDFSFYYDKYEVILSEIELDATALSTQTGQEIVNGASLVVKPATQYFVYARGVKGSTKGEWSDRRILRTMGKLDAVPTDMKLNIDRDDASTYYPIWYENSQVQSGSNIMVPNFLSLGNSEAMFNATDVGGSTNRPWFIEVNVGQNDQVCYSALVLPELTVDLKTVRLNFEIMSPEGSSGVAVVGCMTDARDISTFQPLDTIVAPTGYKRYFIDFANYQFNGKFVAIMASSGSVDSNKNRFRLDKINFVDLPTCGNVTNVVATSPNDPSKIILSWDKTDAKAWVVCVANTTFNYEDIDTKKNWFSCDTVTTNSVEITGLQGPGHKYYYTVRALCDDIAGEWTYPEFFKTGCFDVQSLPYYENFDNTDYAFNKDPETFAIPCMYTQLMADDRGYLFPMLGANVKVSAPNSLVMRKTTSMEGRNMYLGLPKMAAPVKNLQISFSVYFMHKKQSVSVGVMTNPYDSTSIEELFVIKPKALNEFVNYLYTFEEYKGEGEHIVITINDKYVTDDNWVYFDDIMVDYISTCPRPEDVTVVGTEPESVKLNWRTPATVSKWRVVFANKLLSADELSNVKDGATNILKIDTVISNPAEVTGLTPNTLYYTYVQPMCDTTLGSWSNAVKFRTPCEVLTVDKLGVEDFESYQGATSGGNNTSGRYSPTCYITGTIYSGEVEEGYDINNYIPYCYYSTSASQQWAYSGTKSLLFVTIPAYNGAYAITNKIDISDITKIGVKFWGSCKTYDEAAGYAASLIVGVVTDPTDLITFEPIDTLHFSQEFRPYEVYFDKYTGDYNGDSGKYVMFLSDFAIRNRVYIDDVEFDTIPECVPRLTVDSISHDAIVVTLSSAAAPYQVKYSTSMVEEDVLNGNTLDSVVSQDNNTLIISGLKKNTTYYVYARSKCNGAYGDWTPVEIVETGCPTKVTLPFFDDFEDQPKVTKMTKPYCWYSLYTNGGTTQYPSIYKTSGVYSNPSGTCGVLMYYAKTGTQNSYLVTPEIDIDDLSRCQVTFFECNETSNKRRAIIVGAVSDVNDIEGTFEPVDTVFVENYNYNYDLYVSFENYKGTAKHIGFTSVYALNQRYYKNQWTADNVVAKFTLDDIRIELRPTCFPGSDFKMVGHSDNSLEIEFTHEGAPQYEVKYGPVGFNIDSVETSMVIDSITRFTITGLTAGTEYDVYVRTICAEDDKSTWGYAGKYTTAPELVRDMPYIFNFDKEEEVAKWLFSQDAQTNQWFIGADDFNVVSDKGGNALYISNDGAKSAHYNSEVASYSWASRAVALEAGVYTISFDWTCFGEGANDYMRVGFLPTTSTFAGGSSSVKNLDGTSGVLGNALSEIRIQNWIELSDNVDNAYRFNGVDTTLAMVEQWQKAEKTILVTPEMAGSYNMVFYWVNNDTIGEYASKRSAVVDNISIERASCICPHDFNLISALSSEVSFAIISASETKSYEVVVFADTLDVASLTEDKLAAHKQIEGDIVTLAGLTAGVNYKVYVRTICSDADMSIWAGPFEITTACTPIELNTVLHMDDEAEHYFVGATENVLPNCFVGGHENVDMFVSQTPYLVKNTDNVKYSRSGEYALRLQSLNIDKNNTTGGYVVLPLVNGDFATSQLNFWMRCVTNDTLGVVTTTGVGGEYARRVTVGTMTNPYDPTTFVAIGTYEYSYTVADLENNISKDATGNNYWIEVSVPLTGSIGQFVALKNENYGMNNNLVYVDDIEFAQISCFTPNSLRVSDVTSNSAKLDFNHSEALKYIIQRATDTEFTNAQIDTVTTLPFLIDNLAAATAYYVKVQTICSEDTSNWSPYFMFATNKTTPYFESFNKIVNNKDGWQVSNSCLATEAFAGTEVVCSSKFSADTWTTEGGLSGNMFNSIHMMTKVQNTSGLNEASLGSKTWLVSPIIDFTEVTVNYHLMFNLALTDMDKIAAPDANDKVDTDDRFMVIVSDDAGATWKRENATIWGSVVDDYEYYRIPNTGQRYELDLTKYAGKQIRIAFYAEANSYGATTAIHVDDVHVNISTTAIEELTLCESEDYVGKYFSFDRNELTVGKKETSYWELHTENNQADTLRGVSLNVLPMVETILEAKICEGDVYALNNFPSLTEAGQYKQKVTSANGCDSVVVLNLTYIPVQRVTTMDTICSGTSLMWNGKEYNRTGVYEETFVSSLGCDSVVTLILKVDDPMQVEESVNICYGESYSFGSQIITASGDYKETFKTIDGCDSIVLLHATVLPDYRLILNEVIKSGEKYTGHGFEGLSKTGTYKLELESVDGCDSTIVLNLTVLGGDTTYVEFEITTDQLPYEYETLYYDENTKPGVYVDTITVNRDGNEYVIVHTLIVKQGTFVEDVEDFDLIIVPNPVRVNNTLYINAEFPMEERNGLIVEVFNAVGQRVYMDTPSIYPIEINALNDSGVYVVRVVTGNGKSYQDKIIIVE